VALHAFLNLFAFFLALDSPNFNITPYISK
jgi:hypothetical protein